MHPLPAVVAESTCRMKGLLCLVLMAFVAGRASAGVSGVNVYTLIQENTWFVVVVVVIGILI